MDFRVIFGVLTQRKMKGKELLINYLSLCRNWHIVPFYNAGAQSLRANVGTPDIDATLCFNYTGGTTKASRCVRCTHLKESWWIGFGLGVRQGRVSEGPREGGRSGVAAR